MCPTGKHSFYIDRDHQLLSQLQSAHQRSSDGRTKRQDSVSKVTKVNSGAATPARGRVLPSTSNGEVQQATVSHNGVVYTVMQPVPTSSVEAGSAAANPSVATQAQAQVNRVDLVTFAQQNINLIQALINTKFVRYEDMPRPLNLFDFINLRSGNEHAFKVAFRAFGLSYDKQCKDVKVFIMQHFSEQLMPGNSYRKNQVQSVIDTIINVFMNKAGFPTDLLQCYT